MGQLPSSEPGNEPELPNASSGPGGPSLKRADNARTADLRIFARAANQKLRRIAGTTSLHQVWTGIQNSPNAGNAVSHWRNVFRIGATLGARPNTKSVSTGVGTTPIQRRAGLFGAIPKVFSITSSPDALAKPHAAGFTQGSEDDKNRSGSLVGLFSTRRDGPAITHTDSETALTVTTASIATVGGPPTTSPSPSTTTEPSSEATSAQTETSPGKPKTTTRIKTEARIAIKAEGLGSPYVNFHDGVELSEQSPQGSATAVALAAADFDSDGVPDLVTADQKGQLRFRRGNSDTIFPEASRDKSHAGQTIEPFQPAISKNSLSFAPDYFVAGDFDADGLSDILAAAKGGTALFLLKGNGKGDFSEPRAIQLSGKIVAFAAGEIGRADSQTDVAVIVTDGVGSLLLVFESPEGAFKQKPEVFKLSGVGNEITIGDLDGDFYGDVVLASGSNLTIVHGRGQAYPFDRLKERGIKRPAAVVENRVLSFDIAGMAIGRFTEKRGNSLAILSTDGSVHTLETVKPAPTTAQLARVQAVKNRVKSVGFLPVGVARQGLSLLKDDLLADAQAAARKNLGTGDLTTLPPTTNREERYRAEAERAAAELGKLSKEEFAARKAEAIQRADEQRARDKEGFIISISARLQEPLARWNVQSLLTDSSLASGAAVSSRRMLKARVSDSNRDDLVLLDAPGKRIQILTQAGKESRNGASKAEVFSLEADSAPLAVLPMRLNQDALSDLVVLHEGSAVPVVLMTAAASTFVVTTTDDSGGSTCDGVDVCSLREAILLANQNPGLDHIDFNIPGGGVQTIHPLTPLPEITDAVVINAGTQPDYPGSPIIEIRGDQLSQSAEGLRVNASNCVIRGLSIYQMPSDLDFIAGSQIGGAGVILLSTALHPNNGNNFVEANYLGLNHTGGEGSGRVGNDATGLSIFDSDNNVVGGSQLQASNVMSGNGNPLETKSGVGLSVTGGDSNTIQGNLIGTDSNGLIANGNSQGVFMTGKNNLFGGIISNEGNTVSGNGDPAEIAACHGKGLLEQILISDDDGELLTYLNAYVGNNIGTTVSGAAFLGNCDTGVQLQNISLPVFGHHTLLGRNVVSGNGYDALWVGDTAGDLYPPGVATITGNNIGTNRSGNVAIPNDQRSKDCLANCFGESDTVWLLTDHGGYIAVGSPNQTTPDGACTGDCNLIAGNHAVGNPYGRRDPSLRQYRVCLNRQ